jgi:hypothetical protein
MADRHRFLLGGAGCPSLLGSDDFQQCCLSARTFVGDIAPLGPRRQEAAARGACDAATAVRLLQEVAASGWHPWVRGSRRRLQAKS